MLMIALIVMAQLGSGLSADSVVARLRAKIAVEPAVTRSAAQLAGQYTSAPRPKGLPFGDLSGDDLYLFPDGTYIYCEWADIEPVTIYDKGTWVFAGGLVQLRSDPEITWDPHADRTYAVVRRASRKNEILLVGTGSDLAYFESGAGDDPEGMLLVLAKLRARTFNRSSAAKQKNQLLREAWRPEYFRNGCHK